MESHNSHINNTNFIRSNKFEVSFSKIPILEQFIYGVSLPAFALMDGRLPSKAHQINISAGKLQTSEIEIRLQLDEDLVSWEECVKWIYSSQVLTSQYPSETNSIWDSKTDFTVTFNTNSDHPNVNMHYKDCIITNISGLQMEYTGGSEELVFDITLLYDEFAVERLNP